MAVREGRSRPDPFQKKSRARTLLLNRAPSLSPRQLLFRSGSDRRAEDGFPPRLGPQAGADSGPAPLSHGSPTLAQARPRVIIDCGGGRAPAAAASRTRTAAPPTPPVTADGMVGHGGREARSRRPVKPNFTPGGYG